MNITYNPPTGQDVANPSKEFLKEIFLEYPAEYWQKNTGDSALVLREEDRETWVIFFYDAPYGFFIYYDIQYAPVLKGVDLQDDNVIAHIVGSEPMKIPSICYRSRDEAWEIIQDIIENDTLNEKYNWVLLSEIKYERSV